MNGETSVPQHWSILKSYARDALILALFSILAVALTYPVAIQMTRVLPQDLHDTLWFVWALGWNYKTLFAGHLADYWNANIFYPTPGALALGEHAAFLSLLGWPIYRATGSLLATSNFLFLLSFALTGYSTYRLARHFTSHHAASIFAGIAFAFTTYRMDHVTHLNLLQTQWLPLVLLCFLAFIRSRKTIHAAGLAVFMAAAALSSGYYLIFTAILLACLFPIALAGAGRFANRRLWLGFALAGIVVAAAIAPFYLPYQRSQQSLAAKRSRSTAIHYSARPLSFVSGPLVGRVYAPWMSKIWRSETNFFPGVLPLVLGLGFLVYPRNLRALKGWAGQTFSLRPAGGWRFIATLAALAPILAALGLLAARLSGAAIPMKTVGGVLAPVPFAVGVAVARRWKTTRDLWSAHVVPRESYRGLLLLLVVFAVCLSMGPKIVVLGEGAMRGPYYFLHKYVPGVNGLRVPARIAVFAALGVCLLAAYGFADLSRRLAGQPLTRGVAQAALLSGIVIESLSIPLSVCPIPVGAEIPEVYQWLAKEPGDFAVAEVPMGESLVDVRYMYFSTHHWKPLANGYSAYYPPNYEETAKAINEFPAPAAADALRELGVRYLIFHAPQMGRLAPPPTAAAKLIRRFDADSVYEILPAEQR